MRVYPAIDLYEGKVVRLTRGDFREEKVYSDKPEEIAKEWENLGAEWIHVVDLEGARTAIMKNRDPLLRIRKAVRCSIQFGGGLRRMEDIQSILKSGINRVVLGTKALDEMFFRRALEAFGDKIAVSLDIRDGMVQTEGWLKSAQATLGTVLKLFNNFPLKTVIYTDIKKDGMLEGPDFSGLKEVLTGTRARVILSGGVGSLTDIRKCAAMSEKNFEGVIVGKALYEKRILLADAIRIAKGDSSS